MKLLINSYAMMRCYRLSFTLFLILIVSASWNHSTQAQYHCRDPDLGGNAPTHKPSTRKFLIIHGSGAGIGNFLVFFPAAYYFAALTGRDLLIEDGSLIGEMCSVLHCGFPKYSEYAAAFPSILDEEKLRHVRGIKAFEFRSHFEGQRIHDVILRADGYKYQSGWYLGDETAQYCISKITGCGVEDVSCHDRHALERLVRGPFNPKLARKEERLIAGVPANMKHGILNLPHSYAPRFDAAVHLRCNFRNFENLVGPEDTALWPGYVKEVNDWLYSTNNNAGKGLFKEIEAKIMEELHLIKEQRDIQRKLLNQQINEQRHQYMKAQHSQRKLLDQNLMKELHEDVPNFLDPTINITAVEAAHERFTYHGDQNDKIYVYLASDNERVKEAFAEYLIGHSHISVMRVKSDIRIVHGKNVQYLRSAMNGTVGLMNLVLDWYSLSLANIVFAWRQDTTILSSFVQSAQRMGGNYDIINRDVRLWKAAHHNDVNAAENQLSNAAMEKLKVGDGHSRGYQLVYSHGQPAWRFF